MPQARAHPSASRRSVVIIQRAVPHYRVAFFNRLDQELAARGIGLRLLAGQARSEEGFADASGEVAAATAAPVTYLRRGLYRQAVPAAAHGCDLLVVEHASAAILAHLALLAGRRLRRAPIAFWGHGADFQAGTGRRLSRGLKTFTARRADRWFAYTELSREALLAQGVADARITVVDNSIDLAGAVSGLDLDAGARRRIRDGIGIEDGLCAVFCSRLYAGKKLDFLIDAVRRARVTLPDLRLVVIGDGPMLEELRGIARREPWLTPLGALYGTAKAEVLAACDLMLLPSCAGLSILDGFAAALPVLAARFPGHGPEIAYLRDGENGRLTGPDVDAYAAAIHATLSEPGRLAAMAAAAQATAARRSLANMVRHFADGINATLAHPEARPLQRLSSA